MALLQIIYVSRNRITGSKAEVETQTRRILAQARRRNKLKKITGALSFNRGCFAQLLEGEEEDVIATLKRIQLDGRHSDLRVLRACRPSGRLFGDWSMAYLEPLIREVLHPLAHFDFNGVLTDGSDAEAAELMALMNTTTL